MPEQDFLANEQRILGEMEQSGRKARETGLVCKLPKPGEVQAGYIVYLTHDRKISNDVDRFSREVSATLESNLVLYGNFSGYNGRSNVHTTVATYDIKNVPHFQPDRTILAKLSDAASESVLDFLNKRSGDLESAPILNYSQFIHDPGTVVAEPSGEAKDYCELRDRVAQKAAERGIPIKPSWGRHITVGRFTRAFSPEELKKFREIMADPYFYPESISTEMDLPRAVSLNAGHFVLSNERFDLVPYSAFFF